MIKNIQNKFITKKAFHNNEFIPYYQPIFNTDNIHICSMEALLRWNDPNRGILLPKYFIDTIEQNGLINEIGQFIFQETCMHIKRLHEMGYNDMTASVNICENQLRNDSFINFAYNTITSLNIEAKYICLELTERTFLNPGENTLNLLNTLKEIGFKLYLDDFGTKYSSFNYLRCFPFDGIKIDKTFINHIHDSKKSYIIIKNIIRLAHELNLDVIAEGIEQSTQLECLKNMGCDKIQDFLFGKPVCENEFTMNIKKSYYK